MRFAEDTGGMQSRAVDVLRTNRPVDRVRDYSPPEIDEGVSPIEEWSDEGISLHLGYNASHASPLPRAVSCNKAPRAIKPSTALLDHSHNKKSSYIPAIS